MAQCWRVLTTALIVCASLAVAARGQIRFGDCRMSAARLGALCPPADGAGGGVPAVSARGADEALDPTRGLVFDPQAGEVLEKLPPHGRRSE